MPLLKLWNAIRGRSANGQPADQGPASEPPVTTQTKMSNRGSRLGIFASGPHAALCKQLESVSASSILEISVDDGSRAVAVLETITKNNKNVRYLAIDQFEMAAGAVTLKRFHQTLRAKEFRPQVIPETMERGLIRVSHTIGTVDLVLIAAPLETWQTPQFLPLLSRVTHQGTMVLFRDEQQTWKELSTPAPTRRAA